MASRGIRHSPLPPPTVAQQGRVIRIHFDLAVRAHGEQRAPRMMRKFGIKYSELHPFATAVRDAFVRSRNRDQWLAALDEWYDPARDWPSVAGRPGRSSGNR